MKKIVSIVMIAFVIIAAAVSTNAGCPAGSAGVCVAIYDANGKISSYTCSTGATAAEKDCSTGSNSDEEVAP
jgi:hypothetical protein